MAYLIVFVITTVSGNVLSSTFLQDEMVKALQQVRETQHQLLIVLDGLDEVS